MTTLSTSNAAALMSQLETVLRELIATVPSMDLRPVARRKWEHTLEDVDEMLDGLRCACGQPIAGLHGIEFVCQSCLDKWTTCAGCNGDLLIEHAETPVGGDGLYHGGCIGPDGDQ